MKGTNILDSMMSQMTDEMKDYQFLVSIDIHKKLCDELKRYVITYKKMRVINHKSLAKDTAKLLSKRDMKASLNYLKMLGEMPQFN